MFDQIFFLILGFGIGCMFCAMVARVAWDLACQATLRDFEAHDAAQARQRARLDHIHTPGGR